MIQVVVPSYNCVQWIERCMDSISLQLNARYDVVVIDDASTDPGQTELIQKFCDREGWRYRLNEVNMGAGYNIYTAIVADLNCGFDDIVVLVDGDDFLAHGRVFEEINRAYDDPDVWFAWTKYASFPYWTGQTQSDTYPPEVIGHRSYRQVRNYCNHLITFRYFLFQQSVTPKDLQLAPGTWAKAGYDRMMFVPMLERADWHWVFIDEVMYFYNAVNPNSDVEVRLGEIQAAHDLVAQLPVKGPLDERWVEGQRARAGV